MNGARNRTSRRRSSRRGDDGMVLVLSLVVMTAVVAIGVVYSMTGMEQAEVASTRFDRFRAAGLSEGVIEYAYWYSLSNGCATGSFGPIAFGDAQISFDISAAGTKYDIVGETVIGSTSFRYLSRAEMTTDAVLLDVPIFVAGNIALTDSWLGSGDPMQYVGTLSNDASTVRGSIVRTSAINPLGFATARLEAAADRKERAAATIDAEKLRDLVFGMGDLSLINGSSLNGLLVVSGSLTIDGGGGPVSLKGAPTVVSSNGNAVLFVEGGLVVQNIANLTINGAVIVLGNVTFTNVSKVEHNGTLFTNGNLDLDTTAYSIVHSPRLESAPPSGVTGGRRTQSLTELWRIPLASATPPSFPASANDEPTKPADDDVTRDGGDAGGLIDTTTDTLTTVLAGSGGSGGSGGASASSASTNSTKSNNGVGNQN
ncbi:MAG: hypothetical protein KDC38_04810 [Planctomycetes bacterium]|nr:hypothetical protein [Planctomycetota bacterium]